MLLAVLLAGGFCPRHRVASVAVCEVNCQLIGFSSIHLSFFLEFDWATTMGLFYLFLGLLEFGLYYHYFCFEGGLLSYFRGLLGSREMRILILGLDGAGKTTILYR